VNVDKKRLVMNLCAVAVLALLASGCSKVPFAELKAAQAAREEARAMALAYAPEPYNAALALYDQARTEIEEQNSKSGFMRNYSRATELLDQARQGFEKALGDSMAAMAKVKTDAEEKGAGATAAIEEIKLALDGVRKTSRNRDDRERWRQEIESLTYTLEDANDYLASENFREAAGYFDTILADCARIKSEISGT
jgi:hypothetical protein